MNIILMILFIWGILLMIRDKEEGNFNGVMGRRMMVSGKIIRKLVVVFGRVLMVFLMLENGKKILFKVLEC